MITVIYATNKSISLIDGTITDTTTPGQSGTGSNGKEGVLNEFHTQDTQSRVFLNTIQLQPLPSLR